MLPVTPMLPILALRNFLGLVSQQERCTDPARSVARSSGDAVISRVGIVRAVVNRAAVAGWVVLADCCDRTVRVRGHSVNPHTRTIGISAKEFKSRTGGLG